MPALRSAMQTFLRDWKSDMAAPWGQFLDNVEPDYDAIDDSLTLDGATIFPGRKGREPQGAPAGSHVLRAFDGIQPGDVKVVFIGQDPYPSVAQATGRAFEQGDVTDWTTGRVTPSLRKIVQLAAHERTGDSRYKAGRGWTTAKADLNSGDLILQPPGPLFDHWQQQGVLWLNTALTLTKFRDPHQTKGHIPLWNPVVREIVRRLAERHDQPVVVVAWGNKAKDFLVSCELLRQERQSGKTVYVETDQFPDTAVVHTQHPSAFNFLSAPNSLTAVNRSLNDLGTTPINW